jgi:3-oxoacyl-[acyl-carrier protein] reductase
MKNTVLITGASGGIGSAIALRFASEGYCVALQYHTNRSAVERTSSQFSQNSVYLLCPCDLTDPDAVHGMIGAIHEQLGRVSVLVNCAGAALPQIPFSDTTDEQLDRIFNLNAIGTMRLTRLLYDDLRSCQGSVVNLSSVWGVTGGSCEVVYSASKAAVIGFTKALAKELAPSGVTVNCVAPGLIPTAMNAGLSADAVEAFRLETPLQRLGTPEDVANAVFFLANAPFITGQILSCDGGYTV